MPRNVIAELRASKGLDKVKDAYRQYPERGGGYYTVTGASNVDIGPTGDLWRRLGITELIAGTFHSLKAWDDICLMATGTTLLRLSDDCTSSTTVASGLSGNKVCYARDGNDIYFSDSATLALLADGVYLSLPAVTYGINNANLLRYIQVTRKQTPAGHILEFHDNRLLSAVHNVIWKSDPMAYHRTHKAEGVFHESDGGRITLIKSVLGGAFVSDSKQLNFFRSDGVREDRANYPALEGSEIDVDVTQVGIDDLQPGKYFMFAATDGVCVAGDRGFFKNMTSDRYPKITASKAAALLRDVVRTIDGEESTITQAIFACKT